ncbi:HEAT repeat domain-containing protein [Streptomyces sp. NPDC017966]|uniref:HEAT repeat domain-containing protein n=1 Tax=Streptomyces sp. NPDC017966 TaxID=3365023 RepID=UPI0037A007CB
MSAEHQIAHFLRELESPDPDRRTAAAKGLGRTGRPEHAAALVGAAGDPDPRVRAAAAHGLGRLGERQAGPGVLVRLMGDPQPEVRRGASLAALRLGLDDRPATEAYARLLRDPDRHLRINALTALTALGTPGDPVALVESLGDADSAVWGRAHSLVYRLRDVPAVRAEVVRTAREGTGAARARALEMLPARCTERLLDSLLAGLRDPSAQVRTAVVRRLLATGPGPAADALAVALDGERDPETAAWLLVALGVWSDPRALGPAVRWLGDPVAGPRAARALGGIRTEAAAEELRTALDDRALPGLTRAAAAVAIGESGAWDAVWWLLPLLDDADADLRGGALDGLGTLVDDGLRPWERHAVAWALAAHLADGHDVWRTRDALAGLAQALPAVRRLADRASHGEVRAAALSLLDPDGTIGDLRRFVRGLDDPYEAVRYHAALGLTRWAETSTGPLPDTARVSARLTVLTSDASPRLRQAAADALDALGPAAGAASGRRPRP